MGKRSGIYKERGFNKKNAPINGTYLMAGATYDDERRLIDKINAQLVRWPLRASNAVARLWNQQLDVVDRLAKEEAALGNWPRRLLHVPTMTSYEWKPGNWYGPEHSPRYNAISYTWGRWALKDGSMPEVEAVRIKGIPWKVPRIDPAHFTKDEFQAVIRRASTDDRMTKANVYVRDGTIDYVWLDIACIDQRVWEPGSAAEVGRQGQIFGNASEVYIWLSHLSSGDIRTIRGAIKPTLDAERVDKLEGIETVLQSLFTGPWFSSLWTLQEAFLLGTADGIFMPRDGCVPHLKESRFRFRDLRDFYTEFSGAIKDSDSSSSSTEQTLPSHSKDCLNLMDHVGLGAVSSNNGIAALVAANNRMCTNEEDRVYGIQQIFGFKLGVSAKPDSTYTRAELDLQFAQSLLSVYPLLSQLHVFMEPAPFGTAWRPNASSMPRKSSMFQDLMPINRSSGQPSDDLDPMCSLSTCSVDGHVWGQFTGPMCPFETLARKASVLEQDPRWIEDSIIKEYLSRLSIVEAHLDVSDLMTKSPEYRGPGYNPVPNGDRQRALAKWMVANIPAGDLQVLLLGPKLGRLKIFGLLLLRQPDGSTSGSPERWRRLGYCEWWRSKPLYPGDRLIQYWGMEAKHQFPEWVESNYLQIFQGESEDWVETSGYFG